MADVLIRGLQLPTAGQELEFAEGITGKIYARLYPTPDITDYEKDCWHEVISISDHGRLIDADALLMDAAEICEDHGDYAEFGFSRKQIAEAPTIITASK